MKIGGRFIALPLALLAAAAPLGFSDPIPIAETSIAAPPAVVRVDDAVHLFWLDRPPGSPPATGELWHASATLQGRILVGPHRIEVGADTRFAWPAVVPSGARLYVAWMARSTQGVVLRVSVLGSDGRVDRTVSPAVGPAEEGGRISVLASRERVHVAWSQFDGAERRVWYARLFADGRIDRPGRPVADGEAPALAAGESLRLLWWQPGGAGTHTLYAAELGEDLGVPEGLTGRVLLVSPLPPIPLQVPNGFDALDVLIPTTERAFRTAGQLYLVRMRGAAITARLPLSRGRPVGDVSAAQSEAGTFVVWSEPAGRRQNSEIFGATFDSPTGQLAGVTRITYTAAGSFRPAASVGGILVAAWLETLDIARFQLVMGATVGARARSFLLGAPELDPSRPGPAIAFAATVIVSILPYAALFSALFSLGSLAVLLIAGVVLGGFPRGLLRLGGFFGLVLVFQLLGRRLIPGTPSAALLAVSLVVPGAAALAFLRRWGRENGIAYLTGTIAVLMVQMITVLFPWGVRQLSQF